MLTPFFIAIQFLTRIPVPGPIHYDDKAISRSLHFYPLVGLLIGILLFSVSQLDAFLPLELTAIICLTFWVMVTGGLHLDGLADLSDAWVGSHNDKEKFLRIMKDPACGPMGVLSLLLVLLMKFVTLLLVLESQLNILLIFVPAISRLGSCFLILYTPYIRKGGIGEALAKNRVFYSFYIQLGVITAFTLLYGVDYLLLSLVITIIFIAAFKRSVQKKSGGITGDMIGAFIELNETFLLISILVFHSSIT